MCLILAAYEKTPGKRLIIAANRDEFLDRPTLPMHCWAKGSGIIAGKDIKAGGTWLGVTKKGRFAAITNFRKPSLQRQDAPSRGGIVTDFLESNLDPATFLNRFKTQAQRFNGFNLLAGDQNSLYWFSNIKGSPTRLLPGFYGISNHLMNTPWPKVARGKKALEKCLNKTGDITTDALFPLLADRTRPHDDELPDTGVGMAWERLLAPIFIESPTYGTRCSTILIITQTGEIDICERTFDQNQKDRYTQKCFSWNQNPE
ncbi:conserved hypothetical protein [Desulforapulum autotrophicum HRM2]|uniref:NRDE family protein n=1 Tax=Desulforapulum autotrophicum (strain ATCC 43914 / DSM 3382 / VKM B-1955 / HRM2) TaxID=177437 RepID=C0QA03_DESAH|nr:NRDE family protein [Desulforapulum autotrophicum]ACN16721.1 conserved hypothetical protein [Desulforapulum autotrophicum HRM2]